jgi:hypothetical protein
MFSPLHPLRDKTMLLLDYISCVLTILSTVLVSRKLWHGWIFAGVNSALICVIGVRTAQFEFIPANVFCIALYSYNLWTWRRCPRQVGAAEVTGPATRIQLQAEAVASYQPSLVETADCREANLPQRRNNASLTSGLRCLP